MTPKKLETMLILQDTMNAKVNPEWLTAGYAWHRAIMVEGVEALEHHGWKWWKRQTPDIKQVQIELVDIWHFVLSTFLVRTEGNIEQAQIQFEHNFMQDRFAMDGCTTLEKFDFLICAAASGRVNAPAIKGLMADFKLTWDSLYTLYIGKNVLNMFRQDHGYKAGTYIKNWNGKEDNVVLAEIMASPLNLSPSEIYSFLRSAYDDVISAKV